MGETKINNSSKFDELFQIREPESKVKMLLFGESGAGKTILALECFPSPIFLDLEQGTSQYQKIYNVPAAYPKSWGELMQYLALIRDNAKEKGYETLVIDPVSIMWLWCKKDWDRFFMDSRANSKSNKTRYYEMGGLDWDKIKSDWREKLLKILSLDMHIVFIARQKDEVEGANMRKTGETFDCEKSLNYEFDLVVQLCIDKATKKRFFVCKKDRSKIAPLPENEKIALNYDIFRKRVKTEKQDILEEIPVEYENNPD